MSATHLRFEERVSMQGSRLGLIAAVALLAGSAGCSLPQVLPLEGGTTAGPSPYGVWYEQHWATNAVLLAAADQPEEEVVAPAEAEVTVNVDTDSDIGEAPVSLETGEYADPVDADAQAAAQEARRAADEAAAAANAPVEAKGAEAEQFDDSSPYQFPASSFSPGTGEEVAPAGAAKQADAPIRY
jgi:hypothetical protein